MSLKSLNTYRVRKKYRDGVHTYLRDEIYTANRKDLIRAKIVGYERKPKLRYDEERAR